MRFEIQAEKGMVSNIKYPGTLDLPHSISGVIVA
jgi:hypothetical protein